MLCDIIMPVWDQLEATRACVESILRNTNLDYSLIVLDNGSEAATKGYLDGLRESKGPPISVVRNDKNLGFVKAINQGIELSTAPYLCILNNDTLVTRGWLEEMLRVLKSAEDIGIVNPSSNNLGQKPLQGESIEEYADTLSNKEKGRFVELGSAVGFCMLIKRDVIERIGLFDEVYGMGTFEDTDFSRRACREGLRCVRACGAYVYHEEGRSFGRSKGYDSNFARNRKIYESRWGKTRRILYRIDGKKAFLSDSAIAKILKAAREGNWVYIYTRESVDTNNLPQHSNLVVEKFPDAFFKIRTAIKILTKKKKFDERREIRNGSS